MSKMHLGFIPAEQMNVITLALMYYGAKKINDVKKLVKRDLHPYVRDVVRVIAGEEIEDQKAAKTARELIWSNFESKSCTVCHGARVVGHTDNWRTCNKCDGKGRINK